MLLRLTPRPCVAAGAQVHGLPQATDGGRRGPHDHGAGLSTELVAGRRKGTARDGRPQALPAGRRRPVLDGWMLAALAACIVHGSLAPTAHWDSDHLSFLLSLRSLLSTLCLTNGEVAGRKASFPPRCQLPGKMVETFGSGETSKQGCERSCIHNRVRSRTLCMLVKRFEYCQRAKGSSCFG